MVRNLAFTDRGTHLVVSGEFAGQQNLPIQVLVETRGDASAHCIGPDVREASARPLVQLVDADEIVIAGRQQLMKSALTGLKSKRALEFKVAATDSFDRTVEGAPHCQDWQWTESIADVSFTAVELTLVQGGKKVAELECFFDEPTTDGKVSPTQFTCNAR